jgi:hypothetical protein
MGAWGHQFDENDDAADWLADFADAPSWTKCQLALQFADEYIEADAASCAIAAAEVVAAGLGKPNPGLDNAIAQWAAQNSDGAKTLRQTASAAVVKTEDESELQELWEEGDGADWHDTLDDLKSRLI